VFQVDKIFTFFAVYCYSDACILLSQAATGLCFAVILTRDGQVYTCGSNTQGQLGHGDTIDRATPKMVELF
jgi:alpha-tubulin suppressor-like RCC1 family protein